VNRKAISSYFEQRIGRNLIPNSSSARNSTKFRAAAAQKTGPLPRADSRGELLLDQAMQARTTRSVIVMAGRGKSCMGKRPNGYDRGLRQTEREPVARIC